MSKYHKIHSLYKRDPETNFRTFLTEFSRPEFFYLADLDWVCTEKIDGTNIRLMFDGTEWHIGGRTDNAQIPIPLFEKLTEIISGIDNSKFFEGTVLYGEGYGRKIQKVGHLYRPDSVDFVLFDVRVGDTWLKRESVIEIAHEHLHANAAPVVFIGSLYDAMDLTQDGIPSCWGSFPAEGLVCRPAVELNDRMGRRIITKIKTKDFQND